MKPLLESWYLMIALQATPRELLSYLRRVAEPPRELRTQLPHGCCRLLVGED